jgi:cytoskeleton protein RodZ
MSDLEDNELLKADAGEPAQAPVSPGAQLAAGREQLGWTVEQVASNLKLAPRQIHALERDDFAALPGTPSVRGFIRSYAKLLQMDATPLLAQAGGNVLASPSLAPREGLSAPFSETRLPSMGERPAISSRWVVGVLVIVLIAATFWATQQGSGLTGLGLIQAQQSASGQVTVAEPMPETVMEALEPAPVSVAPSAGSAPNATQPASLSAAAPLAPGSPQPAVPMGQQSAPVQGAGGNTLSLKMREESWIEIRRSSGGSALVARLMQAGESTVIELTEPMSVVIGNVAGVDASLRGTPVALKGGANTNVARITLK